jgi:hypothetical protein
MSGDTEPDLYRLSLGLEQRFGVPPLICVNGKAALHKRWQSDPFTKPDVVRNRLRHHHGNTGMVMGESRVGIDLDVYKPEGAATFRVLEGLGWLPDTTSQRTQSGGLHLLYRYDPNVWDIGCGDFAKVVGPDGTPFPGGAEWKGAGGYLVVYQWDDAPAADIHPDLARVLGDRRHSSQAGSDVVQPRTLEACQLLEQHFGGHHRVLADHDGRPYLKLTRPGKDASQGSSVTVGQLRDGTSFFHTPNWPPFEHQQTVDLWLLRQMAGVDTGPKIRVHETETPRALLYGRDVKSEATLWLWEQRLPACQLVLAAGQEKLGKSSALVWVCSRLTTGDLPGDFEGHPMTVVYVSAEDDAAHVLKPRFVAAGADPDRYLLLAGQEPFSFTELRELHPRPGVVVFDPISVFIELRRGSRENDETAIRQALLDFQQLATSEGITVIGVRHTKKGPAGDNALDAVLGSKAWVAAPRALLMFTPDREHEERRGGLIFTHGNLAVPSPPLRYRLDERTVPLDKPLVRPSTGEVVTQTNVVLFVAEPGPVGITLDEALGSRSEAANRAEAEAFLADVLADNLEHLAADVIAEATTAGIPASNLQRATRKLGIVKRREGFGKGSQIWWRLADEPPT